MILQLYSVVGGVFLFKYGPFLFFTYPEWYGIVWALCDITSLICIDLTQGDLWWNCDGSSWNRSVNCSGICQC
jgi:hypothetical protein